MARIRKRKRADGGVTYQVCWVLGGGSAGGGAKEQYESFTNLNRAQAFKLDVENAGHLWPDGWVKGTGYVTAPVLAEPPSVTVNEVAERFWKACERRVARGRLKAYTLHRNKRTWAVHLEPTLGGLAFIDLAVDDIEEWIDDGLDEGAAPKSIRNRHGILHSVMQHGVQREKLRPDNPCTGTELPEVDSHAARQIRFFTHGEWTTFRAGLKDDVVLLCDFLLATGLRWGEVSALRVGDLTAKEDGDVVAHIIRAWSGRSPDDTDEIDWAAGEARKWKLGPPKNKRGRYVVVSGEVASRLKKAIEGRTPEEYVFTRSKTPWRYEDFHYERWRPATEKAKVAGITKRLTPHMLRHTCVVWSLAEGVRIEQISEMLGHASIQITYDVYGGLLDLQDPAVARAMAAAMAR
jgi:integrase